MLIKIHPNSPSLRIGNDLIEFSKLWFPDLKIDKDQPNDIKRLIKKLVRERHSILKTNYLILDVTIPIFLYYDLKNAVPELVLPRLVWKDITFECHPDFTEKEQVQFSLFCKKIKSILKEFGNDWGLYSISDEDSKCKYFAPLSLNGNMLLYFDYLELFQLLSKIVKRKDNKLFEFGNELFKVLSQNSIFFNESNLEIFIANTEG